MLVLLKVVIGGSLSLLQETNRKYYDQIIATAHPAVICFLYDLYEEAACLAASPVFAEAGI